MFSWSLRGRNCQRWTFREFLPVTIVHAEHRFLAVLVIWPNLFAGIQVRQNHGSSFFMHHKFALIDDKYLVNGSFNWTRQAVTGNNENVLITSDCNIVNAFKMEFNKLWKTI